MSVEAELIKINEQLSELAFRINDDGALSMIASPRDEATLRRLRIEAKSLLDQALGVANNFSLSLHFSPVGGSLLGAVEESRAVVEGAVNHLRRGAVAVKKPTDSFAAQFVDMSRIAELKSAKSKDWDLTRLIRICEELNIAFSNNCFMSVAMLGRAVIDHVPPIFGKKNFSEVASQYGPQSFQRSMKNLQLSLRNIADMHLHLPVRRQEVLPTVTQVDFHRDLDVLLGEIARVLKQNAG
jgi:hypothetical protein